MTTNAFGKIVWSSDVGEIVVDKDADVRRRTIIDKNGDKLEIVDALLVDDRERKVRFIEVVSGGFPRLDKMRSPTPLGILRGVLP